ncbi:MAG: GlsB/YeaQ/YmgE family stress response membrane protein, partial [Lysobacterales bacterium]
MNLVAFLIVGIVAGWIAGNLMKGGGFGLVGNMIVGVIGALLGG